MRPQQRPPAIVCDIDGTICTDFDRPIWVAVEVLRAVAHAGIAVIYVTARHDDQRHATEDLIVSARMPGHRHVHYCPTSQSSAAHKLATFPRIAREHTVVAAIGDADEDEAPAHEHGAPFFRVEPRQPSTAWDALGALIGVVR